jgi:hypothetical protein
MKVDGVPLDPDCAEILQAELYKRPRGLCWCNCGQPAPIAKCTNSFYGWKKGQAKRYIAGHQNKMAAEKRRTNGMTTTPEYKAFWAARDRCRIRKTQRGRITADVESSFCIRRLSSSSPM